MYRSTVWQIAPLPNPKPPTQAVRMNISTFTTENVLPNRLNFTYDSTCNRDGTTGPPIIPRSRNETDSHPDLPPNFNYTERPLNISSNVTDYCRRLINNGVCSLEQGEIDFHRRSCERDCSMAGVSPTEDFGRAFLDRCDVEKEKNTTDRCRSCNTTQGCVGGVCVTTVPPCQGACSSHSKCVNNVCVCDAGYSGTYCNVFEPPCGNTTCMNGGVCGPDNTCSCPPQFKGPQCQNPTGYTCDNIQCQHGGTCQMNTTAVWCQCPTGFSGDLCQVDNSKLARAIATGNICCIRKVKGDIRKITFGPATPS